MSGPVDDLPELQIEEVLDPAGAPSVAPPSDDAFEIDIGFDDDVPVAAAPPPSPTQAAAPLPPAPPSPAPVIAEFELEADAIIVDAPAMPTIDRRDTALTEELPPEDTVGLDLELDFDAPDSADRPPPSSPPEAEAGANGQQPDYEAQFDLDAGVGTLSVAHKDEAPAEAPLELGIDLGDGDSLELNAAADSPVASAATEPESEEEFSFEPVAEATDRELHVDAEADAPVLPAAFDGAEPAPTGGAPVVAPPSANALDIEAMLDDMDLGIPPDGRAPGAPEVPSADEPTAVESAGDTDQAPAAGDAPATVAGPALNDELAAALQAASQATEEEEDASTTVDLFGEPDFNAEARDAAPEFGLPVDEAHGLDAEGEAATPEFAAPIPGPVQFEEGAADGPSLLEASFAFAADGAPDDDAPPLPVGEGEPPPVSAISAAAMAPDENTLAALKKLAGPSTSIQETRTALHAALKGESYDPHALPDTRALILGVARVLVATGFSVNEIVDGIVAAMSD